MNAEKVTDWKMVKKNSYFFLKIGAEKKLADSQKETTEILKTC